MSDSLTPIRKLSPATRTSLIVGGCFATFILWTSFWVMKEAQRISRVKEQARALSSQIAGSDMVWIPAGRMTMGAVDGAPDEQPMRDVRFSGFWMDRTEVTNGQFARFVEATKYITVAERSAANEQASGGLVFVLDAAGSRWQQTPGANWRHPQGPSSNIEGREKYPVVQMAWEDAAAFARWAKKRLPTEAQWEYAARNGTIHGRYPWGGELTPGGHWFGNVWQGALTPAETPADGFAELAPVASFRLSNYGLADMGGNVWEWTADWYRADYYVKGPRKDPSGPGEGLDPEEPDVPKRVVRGGSYLSSETNGAGYRTSARRKLAPGVAASDVGFRCIR